MRKLKLPVFLVAFLALLTFNHTDVEANGVERVDGKNRFEVAINISQEWDAASTVILTSSHAYADALAAAPLAYYHNAPILLTNSNSLPLSTKERIRELNPEQVIVIGGNVSVHDSVIAELETMDINNVRRIDGANRYEVAENIAAELPSNNQVVITNGHAPADAMSIAPYAARNGIPIILTKSNNISDSSLDLIQSRDVTKAYVVGGEVSVTPSVLAKLPNPTRIGGRDRFEVAANITRHFDLPTDKAFISNGHAYADALTGSVLMAKQNAPLLLTRDTQIPSPTMEIINDKLIKDFTILGGNISVTSQVVNSITSPVFGKTIVLDPGHGGHDSGATGYGLLEKNVALDISQRVHNILKDAGANVIATRSTDVFVELRDRATIANNANADAFISIHLNAYGSGANGTETFWNSNYDSTASRTLATNIQNELIEAMGTRDRGVKQANFVVIRETEVPSVLVEVGFIDNKADADKLKNENYLDAAAEAIAQGTIDYFKN